MTESSPAEPSAAFTAEIIAIGDRHAARMRAVEMAIDDGTFSNPIAAAADVSRALVREMQTALIREALRPVMDRIAAAFGAPQ